MLNVRNYAIVTAAYWTFEITDGALRMLVLLHFNQLGYSPLQIALLFLLYECMGIVTNALGGWIATRYGLAFTLTTGLSLQILALITLSQLNPSWPELFSVIFVLATQGVSGIAKDLSKMSSKSALKLVVPDNANSSLFKWTAVLTGSKNAFKGAGFFLGGLLLAIFGFAHALWAMAALLFVILVAVKLVLPNTMGKTSSKVKFSQIFSKSRSINYLSAARTFLFGARDVWFVVGLPVFLYDVLHWTFYQVGGFLSAWVIGYGFVQAVGPKLIRRSADGISDEVKSAQTWIFGLALIPAAIALLLYFNVQPAWSLIGGLFTFGLFFAVNSSLHSYLILAFSKSEHVALNVGFYYMANAVGRLLGTLLSGLVYQFGGLLACLATSTVLLLIGWLFTAGLNASVRVSHAQQT
jgi:predicted MFS family arabinose efflux permease